MCFQLVRTSASYAQVHYGCLLKTDMHHGLPFSSRAQLHRTHSLPMGPSPPSRFFSTGLKPFTIGEWRTHVIFSLDLIFGIPSAYLWLQRIQLQTNPLSSSRTHREAREVWARCQGR